MIRLLLKINMNTALLGTMAQFLRYTTISIIFSNVVKILHFGGKGNASARDIITLHLTRNKIFH